MVRLEDIAIGCDYSGISPNSIVTVIDIKWYGTTAINVTGKDSDGNPFTRILYRFDEANINSAGFQNKWKFSADSNRFKLAAEAYRIQLAHLFDPYLAVHTSDVTPLPHQISAVYETMLPKQPLRFLLADDPGAGKTIMTGLLVKELIMRGDVKRCLVVSPGNLVENWQDEMLNKFHLHFDILTSGMIQSAGTDNVFEESSFLIARMDMLSRNQELQDKLSGTEWDLIVVDEAHKMSATIVGGEAKYTQRFQLGRMLSGLSRHFLLLTATPHNGKEEDFQMFLSLIDQDRFERVSKTASIEGDDYSDIIRRLVKEELLTFEGKPLFPERIAQTINYDLSSGEASLYDDVTTYVREEFNRAEKLLNGKRKNTVGFALMVLQRRLASSPEAIYQSLKKRRERLSDWLIMMKDGASSIPSVANYDLDDDEIEDLPDDELEDFEDGILDDATAAQTIEELAAEIETLKELEREAYVVRQQGQDRKWHELSKLLQENERMFNGTGKREKLIIFTEHKDTLNYLAEKVRGLLGDYDAVVTIDGSLNRIQRREAEGAFRYNPDVRILIATDAAGEGINLQNAHLMVNYDLPWNPNRMEQRFGRIHRIGQTEVCYLWNLVAKGTREGEVFQTLFDKLSVEREALGGRVFDILGKITFDNKPLREILIESIRYANDPVVKARLNQVVGNSLSRESLLRLLQERSLTADTMTSSDVLEIRKEMERKEALKLQPHFIEGFFVEAFKDLGGRIAQRANGRYEISDMPMLIKSIAAQKGLNGTLLERYGMVYFDKENMPKPQETSVVPEFVCPGSTLLDATVLATLERNKNLLKEGTVLIDPVDYSENPRLLFFVESTIQDGIKDSSGRNRVVSHNLHFVEVDQNGHLRKAGHAPYLDYRAPRPMESEPLQNYISTLPWLNADVETKAIEFAMANILPEEFSSFRALRIANLDKVEKAVKKRLTGAIQFWDSKAADLLQKEREGKKISSKLSAAKAQKRADALQVRLTNRIEELAAEKALFSAPPKIIAGAIVIPSGLLLKLGITAPTEMHITDRRRAELIGMKHVMRIEQSLGNKPIDRSADNCGYDIESEVADVGAGPALRLIEVKARNADETEVTVTKNEILCARNKLDSYILAIVQIHGSTSTVTYISRPFRETPEWTATSVNYSIENLMKNGKVLLKKEVLNND